MFSRIHSEFLATAIVLLGSLLACDGARGQELGNIAGQIRMQDGRLPPQQILVTLEGRGAIINTTYCESDGRFGFYNLLSNPYYVVIEAEGYQPVRQQVVVVPTVSQTNMVHIVLRPAAVAQSRPSPGSLTNPDVVDVSELGKNFPPSVIKAFEAGMKAEQRGDMAGAIRHYQDALREAPDFYPAHNNLGIRYLQSGEIKEAEEEFRRVLELNSSSAQAYVNLGNVLYLTYRDEEARKALDAGLRLAPSSALGHYLQGSVLARLGEQALAERELKAARGFDPRMPQAPIALATLYLQMGRQKEAVAMFEEFLKQFPKDPAAPKVRDALARLKHSSTP